MLLRPASVFGDVAAMSLEACLVLVIASGCPGTLQHELPGVLYHLLGLTVLVSDLDLLVLLQRGVRAAAAAGRGRGKLEVTGAGVLLLPRPPHAQGHARPQQRPGAGVVTLLLPPRPRPRQVAAAPVQGGVVLHAGVRGGRGGGRAAAAVGPAQDEDTLLGLELLDDP